MQLGSSRRKSGGRGSSTIVQFSISRYCHALAAGQGQRGRPSPVAARHSAVDFAIVVMSMAPGRGGRRDLPPLATLPFDTLREVSRSVAT